VDSSPEENSHHIEQIKQLYANGFEVGMSLSDVTLILTLDGAAYAKINLSFITAKTLVGDLKALIENFESATGQSVMSMREVQSSLQDAGIAGEDRKQWQ
jgi:hypothetical protein